MTLYLDVEYFNMTVANWLGSGWGLTTMLQSAPTHFTIEPNSAYAFLLGLSVGLLVYSIFVSPVYLSSLKHLPGPKVCELELL